MRVAIIGCGAVCSAYLKALEHLSEQIEIVALCDTKVENALRFQASRLYIFESLEDLLRDVSFDAALVSTPLCTHAEIARVCLRHRKHVLLEKPAVLSVSELQELYSLAQEEGVVFRVSFHAAMASEVIWYLEKLSEQYSRFSRENIALIECGFYDPYMKDGCIEDSVKALGGSFLDSGINALSVCGRLLSLDNMEMVLHREKRAEDGTTYASETQYTNHDVQLLLSTGWNKGVNKKYTILSFYGTSDKLILDHSAQEVRQIHSDGRECLLYRDSVYSRLVNHYIRIFLSFAQTIEKPDPVERPQTITVHRLLLDAYFSEKR